ncbi:hypothetical protein ACUXZZ_30070 [Streptomyces graminifolii]|uniref:hypothetical protein n=1 Tax=Streptomyces graminifolii TaxID=1266771 RepID=UPI004059374F
MQLEQDLVAANFRVSPSHNPEGFIELAGALGMAGTEGGFTDRAKGKPAAAWKFAFVLDAASPPENQGHIRVARGATRATPFSGHLTAPRVRSSGSAPTPCGRRC